jgi:hypothetical protein
MVRWPTLLEQVCLASQNKSTVLCPVISPGAPAYERSMTILHEDVFRKNLAFR